MLGKRSLVVLLGLLAAGACISRRVDVVPTLPPTDTADREELIGRINRWRGVESLVLRVDLQFETVEEAEEGEGRKYRTAQGRLLLERPRRIRLNIEAPILSASIAEMASDGERFQLLIHPPEYRALIVGTNRATYARETKRLDEDPELKKAGPLVNIRPQHFTDAFLLSPIEEPSTLAVIQEDIVIERDERPGAARGAQVRKSYYVVTAIRRGEYAPRFRYWFDRIAGLTLSRLQTFDESGRLASDIRYSAYGPPDPETGVRIATTVRIERPYDDYTLVLRVRPDGVQINRDLPDTAFEVKPPPEWADTLRRIDLDEREKSATDAR